MIWKIDRLKYDGRVSQRFVKNCFCSTHNFSLMTRRPKENWRKFPLRWRWEEKFSLYILFWSLLEYSRRKKTLLQVVKEKGEKFKLKKVVVRKTKKFFLIFHKSEIMKVKAAEGRISQYIFRKFCKDYDYIFQKPENNEKPTLKTWPLEWFFVSKRLNKS